ncbi:MAG: fibronectin type III domain-containing protein [Deltaproteobacteria bacterium]|nr:fibronectin type III domain-containing protein [Deltaproteobacteria bacterium]MBW2124234.1 fibronectin type III domain-containing protein [Deltaproteobacteria bacterium]
MILVLLTVPIAVAGVIAQWDGLMYVAQDKITFAWDPSQGADYYEVQALWIDPTSGPVIYDLGQTSDTQMEIMKPRTGHFYFRVRACNEAGCSDWSESIDPEKTQIGKPFRVYFKTAPPQGGITIE